MARKVFFSFHYWKDAQRAWVVRNSAITKDWFQDAWYIDAVEREKIKKHDPEVIEKWIDEELKWTSVTVVLIWSETDSRYFVKYELKKSWEKWNWIVWVYIHNIKWFDKKIESKWWTNFGWIFLSSQDNKTTFDQRFKTYDRIEDDWYNNLWKWIEEAAKDAWK